MGASDRSTIQDSTGQGVTTDQARRSPPKTPLERLQAFEANDRWFIAHYPELLEQYGEAFVAVLDEKVLANAPALPDLLAKLPDDCDRGIVVIERVTRDEDLELL